MNTLLDRLNTQSAWVFQLGLAAVLMWNAWKARQDRALALRLQGERPEAVELKETLKVSVLVAAWNEAGIIREHIESFLRLRYPNRELILCAGGDDGTYQTARQYAGEQVVVLEQQPGEGKQRALQRCWNNASGQVIFLSDADCLLDDDSFTQILAPLVNEGEDVATGTSRPLQWQLNNPFVVYQWCTDLHVNARRSKFIRGILGRNCALKRQALERIGGFASDVYTGTDYHTAKLLLKHGYRIRYVRDSAVQTRYPATFRSYWRRQSRWVRNLMVYGPVFGAYDELARALRTSLVGWAMLLLPWASIAAGPTILAIWGVLLGQAFLAKLRYARFARLYQGIEISAKQYLLTPVYVFVDFVAWSLPLVDLFARRRKW